MKKEEKIPLEKTNTTQLNLISGFPRSGSTLLCQILNMNPDFHATATSGLLDAITAQCQIISHNPTFKAVDRHPDGDLYYRYADGIKAFVKAFINTDKKYYFDKNRGWPGSIMRLDEIMAEDNESKIIWTYRNPLDIVASIESRHRQSPILQFADEINSPGSMNSLDARISMWTNQGGIVGAPLALFIDMINMGYDERIHIVDYKDLCTNTQETMDKIHEFLDIEKFNYSANNFSDLKQVTEEFDGLYNYKFPHTISEGGIKYKESDLELPDLYKKAINERFDYINKYVQAIKAKDFKKTTRSERRKLKKA